MSTPTPAALAAIETHRRTDGKFGEQHRGEAGIAPVTPDVIPTVTHEHPLVAEALNGAELDDDDKKAVSALFWDCEDDDSVQDRVDDLEGWSYELHDLMDVADKVSSWSGRKGAEGPQMSVTFPADGDGYSGGYYQTEVHVPKLDGYYAGYPQKPPGYGSGMSGAVYFAAVLVADGERMRAELDDTFPGWRDRPTR